MCYGSMGVKQGKITGNFTCPGDGQIDNQTTWCGWWPRTVDLRWRRKHGWWFLTSDSVERGAWSVERWADCSSAT